MVHIIQNICVFMPSTWVHGFLLANKCLYNFVTGCYSNEK